MTEKWYFGRLACPDCEGFLVQGDQVMACRNCDFSSPLSGCLDLRPRRARNKLLDVPVTFSVDEAFLGVTLDRPRISYREPIEGRDSRELLSLMDQTLDSPGCVLDLGCGPKDQSHAIQSLGHDYVGIDIFSPAADIRGDAHVLPFQESTFHCVFSFAVLEHLQSPLVALSEIKRVLRPNGIFLGTVAQGEPFHNSFFHHTSWGVLSLAHAAGLKVDRLWTCTDTLSSLASMGRYPRVLRCGIHILDRLHTNLPFLAPRKLRWPKDERLIDALHRAGSIGFVMRKPSTN